MGLTYEDLSPFMACCIGRGNDYALQMPDGNYSRQGRLIDYDLVYRHLTGQVTIGTYVINEFGTSTFAVFDHDSPDPARGLSVLLDVQAKLSQGGVVSYLERSRRGGHLWVFCEPVHPAVLRAWLLPYCPVDSELEFYPKQDTLSDECLYGACIRVPLGIHRLTGERYRFVSLVNGSWVDLFTSYSEALAFFAHVVKHRNIPPSLEKISPPISFYPSKEYPSQLAAPQPTLGGIAEWCLMHDPYTVIGRYVQLDRYGSGCCPFGSHHSDGVDSHPSFFVYSPMASNIMCWYCHVWGRGGSLFDFLKLYYGMSARDLWSALRQGAQF